MRFKIDKSYYLLALIILVACVLRFYKLDSLPIFADESIYVRWAQIIKNEPTLRFIPLSDGKPPLYMWVVWQVLTLFKDPLVAGRFVSGMFGLVTIVGIYFTSIIIFNNKKSALLASLIYALSPLSLFFDRMALVDAMLAAFGIWTFYFAYLSLKLQRYDLAMLAGFVLGAAFLTKPPALFFALLLPTLLLMVSKVNLNKIARNVKYLLPTYLIAFVIYNVLRLGPNFYLLMRRNYDYVYPYSHLLTSPFSPLISHSTAIFNYIWIWGPGILFILLILGKISAFKKKSKELFIIALWALIPIFAVAEFSKTITVRYILFTYPFAAIIMGLSVYNLKNKLFKNISLIAVTIFVGYALFIDYKLISKVEAAPMPRSERSGYLEEWTAGTGIQEIANTIRDFAFANPKTQVIVGAEGSFGTPFSALELYLNGIPNIVVIGIGVGLTDVPQSLVDAKAAGNKVYMVINSTRLNAKIENLDVQLLATYPKATNPNGTIEYLYFFEVQ